MSEYFCSFASGSTGNCAFYSGSGARVLIDAGTNTKHISACLRQLGLTTHDLTHILLTHAHSDHTGALPVLMRHTNAQLLCSEGTARRLNIDWEDITVFGKNERLLLQELEVQTFATSHDSPGSCGYVLGNGGARVGYCTDLGIMTDEIYQSLAGAPTLFIESNHDIELLKNGRYPYHLKQRILGCEGHLSNADCAKTVAALAKTGTKTVILAHLSEENNTPRHALTASIEATERCGAAVKITVAPKSGLSDIIYFEESGEQIGCLL